MDTGCQSIWTYTNLQHIIIGIQMPNYTDLQLYPHTQSNKATYDHRKANANLQGLIIATSHTQTEAKHGCQMPIYLGLL